VEQGCLEGGASEQMTPEDPVWCPPYLQHPLQNWSRHKTAKISVSDSPVCLSSSGVGNLKHSKSHLDPFPTGNKTLGATKAFSSKMKITLHLCPSLGPAACSQEGERTSRTAMAACRCKICLACAGA